MKTDLFATGPAPGDLQNESADHLAEEQNHDGLNVRY